MEEKIDIDTENTEEDIPQRIFKRQFVKELAHRITKKRREKDAKCRKCSVADAADIYDCFTELMAEELINGDTVILMKLGSLTPKIHKGHKHRETVNDLSDYVFVKFKAADDLYEKMRDTDLNLIEKLKKANAIDNGDKE